MSFEHSTRVSFFDKQHFSCVGNCFSTSHLFFRYTLSNKTVCLNQFVYTHVLHCKKWGVPYTPWGAPQSQLLKNVFILTVIVELPRGAVTGTHNYRTASQKQQTA